MADKWGDAKERAESNPAREDDLKHLASVLEDHDHEISQTEADAFGSMRERLHGGQVKLTHPQRVWLAKVVERVTAGSYENLVSSGKAKIGAPVETPFALRRENLPLKPPGRK